MYSTSQSHLQIGPKGLNNIYETHQSHWLGSQNQEPGMEKGFNQMGDIVQQKGHFLRNWKLAIENFKETN